MGKVVIAALFLAGAGLIVGCKSNSCSKDGECEMTKYKLGGPVNGMQYYQYSGIQCDNSECTPVKKKEGKCDCD
jgi:hypothetical protein